MARLTSIQWSCHPIPSHPFPSTEQLRRRDAELIHVGLMCYLTRHVIISGCLGGWGLHPVPTTADHDDRRSIIGRTFATNDSGSHCQARQKDRESCEQAVSVCVFLVTGGSGHEAAEFRRSFCSFAWVARPGGGWGGRRSDAEG